MHSQTRLTLWIPFFDLSRVFGKKVRIHMFTDSKQVFEIITRGKCPTEKRLAVYVIVAREAYQKIRY